MPKNDISKEKAILAILKHEEEDFNRAMDALILIATAAKRKTSVGLVGASSILNEKEPEPESEQEQVEK